MYDEVFSNRFAVEWPAEPPADFWETVVSNFEVVNRY